MEDFYLDDEPTLFEMERRRPFKPGDPVVVDTILGVRHATVQWSGFSEGYPAVRVLLAEGTYTVSGGRVRHDDGDDGDDQTPDQT